MVTRKDNPIGSPEIHKKTRAEGDADEDTGKGSKSVKVPTFPGLGSQSDGMPAWARAQETLMNHMTQSVETLRNKVNQAKAMAKEMQFAGSKGGPAWRSAVRKYLVSRATDIGRLLQYAEENEDRDCSCESIILALNLQGHEERAHYISRELWAFLNLNLTEQAHATYDNVRELEGFEAWKRTMSKLSSTLSVLPNSATVKQTTTLV